VLVMKQLFSARTGLGAHDIRLFLEARGVKACALGENGLEVGIAFTPLSTPSVYVDDGNIDEARGLLLEYRQMQEKVPSRRKWTCLQCGEGVGDQFDSCWNCGTPGEDDHEIASSVDIAYEIESTPTANSQVVNAASEPALLPANGVELDPAQRFELRLEIAVALCVVWAPYFLSGMIGFLWPTDSVEWPFIAESLWQIAGFVPGVAVILYLIHRGNTPWHVHGFRRPRIVVDTAAGFAIWMASLLAVGIVQRFCTIAAGAERWSSEPPSNYGFAVPSTTADFILLIVLSIAIGFSEELAMRSYLIPRFEQLFRSSATSVFVSSALFASYHLYQGLESAFSILVIGLVYGTAFCMTRRLWPVAIAHAMMDIWAIGATAAS
jgi:membrane protease YdiL (CAAX protease family)